jgi:CubicO group peptidase (beta-lactamase class C family)
MRDLKILFGIQLLIILLFTGSQSLAQSNQELLNLRVDSLFSFWNTNYSPGCALGIIKDGTLIYEKDYGLSNLEYDIPITPKSIFHLASISKQFTAFSIALLAQQGKLSLDDDIRKYLPEIPDFGEKISIKNLIYHTSGLRDQWELLSMAGWRLDDVITKEQILKMISHQKELNFNPGDEFLYCNTGYTLLAEIVSRVSGKPFTQFTKENIFDPLGMKDTHFHNDHEEIVKNRTYSYYQVDSTHYKNAVLSYANAGATSLFSTVEDLAKWLNNFDNPVAGNKKIIQQMYEQGVLNNGTKIDYGFGLAINDYKGLKTIGHGGADAGYRSYICRFPDQHLGVILLSNLDSFNPSSLANKVADIYLSDKIKPDTVTKKIVRKEIVIDSSEYYKYTGSYQIFPGFILNITDEDNKLMVEATGQGKTRLLAESDTEFFVNVVDAQLTFENPNQGRYSKIILHQNGQNLTAQRIDLVKINPAELKEYEGNYYSEELGTFYTIAIIDTALHVSHRRNPDVNLNFAKKDSFTGDQWWFAKVVFTRDKSNHVSGFLLTGSRVRNLKFAKM